MADRDGQGSLSSLGGGIPFHAPDSILAQHTHLFLPSTTGSDLLRGRFESELHRRALKSPEKPTVLVKRQLGHTDPGRGPFERSSPSRRPGTLSNDDHRHHRAVRQSSCHQEDAAATRSSTFDAAAVAPLRIFLPVSLLRCYPAPLEDFIWPAEYDRRTRGLQMIQYPYDL